MSRELPGATSGSRHTSHQTGWIGLIARTMHLFATSTSEEMLTLGKVAFINEVERPSARGTKRDRGR